MLFRKKPKKYCIRLRVERGEFEIDKESKEFVYCQRLLAHLIVEDTTALIGLDMKGGKLNDNDVYQSWIMMAEHLSNSKVICEGSRLLAQSVIGNKGEVH